MTDRWTADPDELRQRKILVDAVGNELTHNERETGIQFFGDADRFQIITYAPPLVRKLLRHEYAKIKAYFRGDGGGRISRIAEPSEILNSEDRAELEGVRATLPIGALSIKGSPRKRDRISSVVSTPQEARDVAEVFGGDDDG